MSWQKCVTGKPYRLSMPVAVYVGATGLHWLVLLSSFGLSLPSDCIALGWLLVWRSWLCLRRYADALCGAVIWIDMQGYFNVNESCRNNDNSGSAKATACLCHSCFQSALEHDSGWLNRSLVESDFYPGGDQIQYTCRRTIRIPGCVALSLVCDYAKPLEILVFYRYDQRQLYQRLKRYVAYL